MSRNIAILTDFGSRDAYVGIMKGVMSRIAPEAHFIDITHEIQPQNVRQAAFALLNSYRYFAPGTVFLVVVDPGVGGTRKPIAAQAGDYFFVAPDNGVLSYVLAELETVTIVELSSLVYQLTPVSYTFHGRDIFAPAAAHLAIDVPVYKFGATVEHIYKQLIPQIRIEGSQITGQVFYSDHFGNIVTSIGELSWQNAQRLRFSPRFGDRDKSLVIHANQAKISFRGQTLARIQRTYGEVSKGELLALVGSSGFLEIALNQGSAAQELNLQSGETVILQIG